MLNQEQYRILWPQIKGAIRNMWGSLSLDEVDRTDGDLSAVASLVQDKTGEDRSQIKEKIEQILASFDNETDKGIDPDRASYGRRPVPPVNEDWTPRH